MELNDDSFELLKEKRVPTFLSKEDIKTIINALEANDRVSRETFRSQYTEEYIRKLANDVLGRFTDTIGKSLFILDGLISTGTAMMLLLPLLSEEEIEATTSVNNKEIASTYQVLLDFYKGVLDQMD